MAGGQHPNHVWSRRVDLAWTSGSRPIRGLTPTAHPQGEPGAARVDHEFEGAALRAARDDGAKRLIIRRLSALYQSAEPRHSARLGDG